MAASSRRLRTVCLGLMLLLMGGTLLYIRTPSHLPLLNLELRQQGPDYRVETETCYQHVHLCWLRQVLTTVFNQTMSHNVFDMTNLYKFQTHIYLDKPGYHNTAVRHYMAGNIAETEGKKVLQYMKDEAFINGYQRPLLNLNFGVDIDGRNCSYNPYLHYSYTYQMYYTSDRVLVYVVETPVGKAWMKNVPNYIMGSIKTKITVSPCKNVNYFINGTYLFSCPVLEYNSTITITATYISTATSNFRCDNSINKPIWTLKEFPVELKHKSDVNKSAKSKCTSGRRHETGFWLKVGALSHWATNNCYYPYHFDHRQLKCLSSKSVIMFGDSHTQRRCGMCIKKAYKLDLLVQHQTAEALNLLVNLLNVYKRCLIGKCVDVLVANVAHHDLRELDFIAYIAGMSDIFKMFKLFKKLNKPPQIIWIETTPVAENGFHGRMMTNQAVEAVNDWVNHNMKSLGVDIVYAYKMAIAMTSQNIGDGSHYHCFLGRQVNDNSPKVNVGGAIVSVLVNMICPLS